jgi:alpha-beta hydrolase superfamily lysophospholipase
MARTGPISPAARASVDAVNNHLGPVIVWGHSLGSGVAARIASEGRAAGLVLDPHARDLSGTVVHWAQEKHLANDTP